MGRRKRALFQLNSGGVAQLGARLNGIQEVRGSIPLVSTKKLTLSSNRKRFCCSDASIAFDSWLGC